MISIGLLLFVIVVSVLIIRAWGGI